MIAVVIPCQFPVNRSHPLSPNLRHHMEGGKRTGSLTLQTPSPQPSPAGREGISAAASCTAKFPLGRGGSTGIAGSLYRRGPLGHEGSERLQCHPVPAP